MLRPGPFNLFRQLLYEAQIRRQKATEHPRVYPCAYARVFGLSGQRSSFKAQQPEPPSLMMWQLRCVLNLPFLLATTAFVLPSGSNGPLQAALRVHPESPTPGSDREWNLPPNPNSTHHLIFNSVAGFLQRWPNTLRRNGAKLYCIYHRSHVNLLPRS